MKSAKKKTAKKPAKTAAKPEKIVPPKLPLHKERRPLQLTILSFVFGSLGVIFALVSAILLYIVFLNLSQGQGILVATAMIGILSIMYFATAIGLWKQKLWGGFIAAFLSLWTLIAPLFNWEKMDIAVLVQMILSLGLLVAIWMNWKKLK